MSLLQALLVPLRALGLVNGRRPDSDVDGLVVLTSDQIRHEVEQLSQQHLQCTPREAFRRLDAGELENHPVAFELRGYRYLAGAELWR